MKSGPERIVAVTADVKVGGVGGFVMA